MEREKGNIEIVGIACVAEIRRRLPEPSPRAPPRCFGFSFSARAKNKTKAAETVSELNEILIQRSDRCGSALWRFDKEGSGRVEEGVDLSEINMLRRRGRAKTPRRHVWIAMRQKKNTVGFKIDLLVAGIFFSFLRVDVSEKKRT